MEISADFVFFFALREELKQAYDLLKSDGATVQISYLDGRDEYRFSYKQRHGPELAIVLKFLGDQGNLRTATSIIPYVLSNSFKVCVLVGIAGTLDAASLDVGDVVLSAGAKIMYPDKLKEINDSTELFSDLREQETLKKGTETRILIDTRKRFLDKSFFRFRRGWVEHSSSLTTLTEYFEYLEENPVKLEAVPQVENENPKIKMATVLGSDFVFDSEEYLDFVKSRNELIDFDYYNQKNNPEDASRNNWQPTELLAVDMESYGFFSALMELSKETDGTMRFFSIRGISDYASKKEELDRRIQQQTPKRTARAIAASNCVLVAFDLLKYLKSKDNHRRY